MSTAATRALIFGAKRTPICGLAGALSIYSAPELGAIAIKAALAAAKCSPENVEEVIMGNVLSAGIGQAPARQASIRAGIPHTAEATTINKVCSSGLKAVALAAIMIEHGTRTGVVVAGGMESMSRAPYLFPRLVSPKFQTRTSEGHPRTLDGMIHDGLWDAYDNIHMGSCAEQCAASRGVNREDMDSFSSRSYELARSAWSAAPEGRLPGNEVVSVGDKNPIHRDSECHERDGSSLASARPAFAKGGAVTAGNASKISDGAAALVLAPSNQNGTNLCKSRPLAEIIAYGEAAVAPVDFPLAPEFAIKRALKKANLSPDKIALWEINEAFAAVAVINQRIFNIPDDRLNVCGGAVAIGHPIGASGARILVTLVHSLKAGEYGCAAICNGGGGASAMIIKRL